MRRKVPQWAKTIAIFALLAVIGIMFGCASKEPLTVDEILTTKTVKRNVCKPEPLRCPDNAVLVVESRGTCKVWRQYCVRRGM
ncbi:hypothetical protein CMI47_04600 [Candidatus Pacearchaeota archaeon]|jgi:hypothetical protein|nr:hypothetical protein [Candidatus Pacearchaeota archaeon]